MSGLTMCNHCSMLALERRAKAKRMKLSQARVSPMVRTAGWGPGVAVYMLPKQMKMASFWKLDDETRDAFFVAEFAELPDHCCC